MDIRTGRKWLSTNQYNEVIDLESREQKSKNKESKDKVKFTKKDRDMLQAYYKMIDYLGSVNG